ncbi:MAG: POTRA domain-containing protein [Cyanobacteria bacterium P01_A01_bin.68]
MKSIYWLGLLGIASLQVLSINPCFAQSSDNINIPPYLLLENTPNPPFPSNQSVLVTEIKVEGNSVLEEDIIKLTKRLLQKKITLQQLLQLRTKITQLYIKKGYITSGAFIPNNQNFTSGVVQIQVVEGKLEDIVIYGLKRLQKGYVRSRIQRFTGKPLNQKRLIQAFQLLQNDPAIERLSAELAQGTRVGYSILEVTIREAEEF